MYVLLLVKTALALSLRTSTFFKFKIANLEFDKDLLYYAHEDAIEIIKNNRNLKSKDGKNIRILLHLMNKDKSLSLLETG